MQERVAARRREDKNLRSKWSKIVPHSTPIYQTSVYDYPDLETFDDYYTGKIPWAFLYSRNGLPNSSELGKLVADEEKTDSGLVCSSGMGALLVAMLSMLGEGDRVVASNDLYGGTSVLLKEEFKRFGIASTFVDSTSQLDDLEQTAMKGAKLILVESISNPTMKVCDIKRVSEIAKKSSSVLIVDNTFATPFVVTPSQLGADIVMHSGTKFLGGHGDLTIGLLCGRSDLISRASQFCTRAGVIAGPFDCWLATRSLATWRVRVKESCSNALKLAKYLESRSDKVARVYYPGLASHPQHNLAKKMFSKGMFGGMLSFDLRGGLPAASAFAKRLRGVTLTPSLGSTRTTISHPGKTSHRYIGAEQRRESGITDAMIRVSVGIEDYETIEIEFKNGLDGTR